jgi:hypothetical protein
LIDQFRWAGLKTLYIPPPPGILRPVMDAFWSIFAMPIGVAMCFGPAMVIWWLVDSKKSDTPQPQKIEKK